MKLLMLLLLTACATMSEGEYKRTYPLADFNSSKSAQDTYQLLKDKMTKCYPQSDYPTYQMTTGEFDQEKEKGTIRYKVDNQTAGSKILVLVEVAKNDQGSLVKTFSRGDLFHAASVYRHQIQKWLDGKKVDCDARGEI